MQGSRLLSLREVERCLSLSRWTLYEMIRSGRLQAVKLSSGQYRVSETVVEAMMRGSGTGGTQEVGAREPRRLRLQRPPGGECP